MIQHDPSAKLLNELEAMADLVDRLATDAEAEAVAFAKRQRLLIELDVAGLLTGQPEVGGLVAGHPTLRGYHDACLAMTSYYASAARQRLTKTPAPARPADGCVSLDWFRTPSGYTPPGVSEHDWLALCERNFSEPMPTAAGTRFVRLERRIHVLSYRVEVGPEPKLWRAELAGG